MSSFRILALAFALAACGSSPKTQPTTTTTAAGSGSGSAVTQPAVGGAVLGLAEIKVSDAGKDVLAIHANGDVEIVMPDGTKKTIGKLDTTGKLTTADNQVGQVQPDGSFTTPEGPVPFHLDGASLVAGDKKITIENGKLVGGGDTASTVSITGADTDATKRTTLLMLGLLLTASEGPPAGSAAAAPGPAPLPTPAPHK